MASSDQLLDIIEPSAPLVESYWQVIDTLWLSVLIVLLIILLVYWRSLLSYWQWRAGLFNVHLSSRNRDVSQRELAFILSDLLCRRYQLSILYTQHAPDRVNSDEWFRCVSQLNQLKYSSSQPQQAFAQLLNMVKSW